MERKTLENDPQELERFKQEIDLVAYAQRQGYQIKSQGRRGDWHHLVNDGEHLIVSRKDQRQVYFNPGDDWDRGTIIDFVKTRENKNLGEVRQHLREYLDGSPYPQELPPPAPSRPGPLPPKQGHAAESPEEEERKRTRLIAEVLGVRKELSDRSYLHSRGLTDETIDSPAFQGRVFTSQRNNFRNTAFPLYNERGLASVEQKNKDYRSLLELPKDGIWVSFPTQGKGTPVERLVITESAIDAMSYHQLKHDGKNTMYIATAGTVTDRQTELIQKVIDKQQPREVILADDRDAAGRRYNINYLNDLQVARPFQPVADQEAYREATRPLHWHATLGRYHTHLRVDVQHQSFSEGTERVQPILRQVERINSTQEEPSIEVSIQRSTEKETVLRLSVARADTAQLEVLSQELYRQREQLRPVAERQPANFLRVDYPLAKDFNRDLELANQGLSAEQIRRQALLDEQEKEKQRVSPQPPKVDPEREKTPLPDPNEKSLSPSAHPFGDTPGQGAENQLLIRVEEQGKGADARGKAEAVQEALRRSGARVGELESSSDGNLRRSEMKVSYRTDQEEIGKISRTLDAVGSQKGNQVLEPEADRSARREIAGQRETRSPGQQELTR